MEYISQVSIVILVLTAFAEAWVSSQSSNFQLVDGETPFDGRVMVYIDEWKPMCDSYINPNVSRVICRELGYPPNNVTLKNEKYTNKWETWLRCTGEEGVLNQCHWAVWPKKVCPPEESIGISCNGNTCIRLAQGPSSRSGNIELFQNGAFKSICDTNPDFRTATIVCRQLGFETDTAALILNSYFGAVSHEGTQYVRCNGEENFIQDCQFYPVPGNVSCSPDHALGVDCNVTQIYLYKRREEGDKVYVDIDTYGVFGYWSESLAVSNRSNKMTDLTNIASVVCHMLGYSRYNPDIYFTTFNGGGSYPLELSMSLQCTGREERLAQCSKLDDLNGTIPDSLSYSEIALGCIAPLRLMAIDGVGNGVDSGLLMYLDDVDGIWQPFADVRTDYSMAVVACRQLGIIGKMVGLHFVDPGSVDQRLYKMEHVCSGSEATLRDCQRIPWAKEHTNNVLAIDCNAAPVEISQNQTKHGVSTLLTRSNKDSEWGVFCTSDPANLDINLASVICHQLGRARAGAVLKLHNFTGHLPIFEDISGFHCTGMEENIRQCPKYQTKSDLSECKHQVGIQCAGVSYCRDLIANPVPKKISCYKYSCVKKPCDNVLGDNSKVVTCSLQDGMACKIDKAQTVDGTTWLYGGCEADCSSDFMDDSHLLRTKECCFTSFCNLNTAAVRTLQVFQLVSGVKPWEGFVQFFKEPEQRWMFLADQDDIPYEVLDTLCTQCGYHLSAVAKSPNDESIVFADEFCVSASNYKNCNVKDLTKGCFSSPTLCPKGRRLRINCKAHAPKARLVDGGRANKGRVELYIKGEWGTICSKNIVGRVSDVLCNSLGFNRKCSTNSTSGTHEVRFRSGQGKIHMTAVNCVGNEDSIYKCTYSEIGADCSHDDDFGVICEDAFEDDVPALMVTEQPAIPSPSSTRSNYLDNQITTRKPTQTRFQCFSGQCANDCGQELLRSSQLTCIASNSSFCFVDKEMIGRDSRIFRFGCSTSCNLGVTRATADLTRYCCAGELCNALNTEVIENITTVVENTAQNFTISEPDPPNSLALAVRFDFHMIIYFLFVVIKIFTY